MINATSVYGPLFPASSDWLKDTYTAIQNDNNAGGLLGMLRSAGSNDGSLSSFLSSSASTANNFALISQNTVTNASSLVAQIASQNQKTADTKKLQDALASLSASQQAVAPKNVLDPIIFFDDGSTIDTNSNILTMADRNSDRYDDRDQGHRHIVAHPDGQWRLSRYEKQRSDYAGWHENRHGNGTEDLGDGLTVTEFGARSGDFG